MLRGINLLRCILCGGEPAHPDLLGFPWCETHQDRGKLMNAGKLRGWQEVKVKATRHALAPDPLHWWLYATYASDEHVQAALVEAEEVAG